MDTTTTKTDDGYVIEHQGEGYRELSNPDCTGEFWVEVPLDGTRKAELGWSNNAGGDRPRVTLQLPGRPTPISLTADQAEALANALQHTVANAREVPF